MAVYEGLILQHILFPFRCFPKRVKVKERGRRKERENEGKNKREKY